MGYKPSWKESISKRTSRFQNRRFNEMPFLKLIELLKYKCQKVGIRLITLNESFTSKCSALHLEKICKHETYQGVRRGGYFKSDKGFLNADINGAINILRRFVNDNDFVKGLISSNHIFNPKRLKLAEITAILCSWFWLTVKFRFINSCRLCCINTILQQSQINMLILIRGNLCLKILFN